MFRSQFRVGRISLTTEHLAAYYGVDVSEAEDFAATIGEKTIADQIANSTVAPSFHCTIPNSPFESYYRSSLSTQHMTQYTRPSSAVTNDENSERSERMADFTVVSSFHCTLPRSPFGTEYESSFSQTRSKSSTNDIVVDSPVLQQQQKEAGSRCCSSTMDYSMQKLSMSTLTAFDKETELNWPTVPTIKNIHEQTLVGECGLTVDFDNGIDKSVKASAADESTSTLRDDDFGRSMMTVAQLVAPPVIARRGVSNATSIMDYSLATGSRVEMAGKISSHDVDASTVVDLSVYGPNGSVALQEPSTNSSASDEVFSQLQPTAGEPPNWSQQQPQRVVPRFSTVGLYGAHRSVIGPYVGEHNSTGDESSTTYASSKRSTTPNFPNIPYIVPKAIDAGNPALRKFQALMADFDDGAVDGQQAVPSTNVEDSTTTLTNETSSCGPTMTSTSKTVDSQESGLQVAVGHKSVFLPTYWTKALTAELQQQFQQQSVKAERFRATEENVSPLSQTVSQMSVAANKATNDGEHSEVVADKAVKFAIKRPQEFGRKSMALREIICNYSTPPSASRASRRKSVTFKNHAAYADFSAGNSSIDGEAAAVGSDEDATSPAVKQILLRRTSLAASGQQSRPSPLFGKSKTINLSAESRRVLSTGDAVVVGSLDDGGFTTLQSRDSFFSEISDLSPIKGGKPSTRGASFATNATSSPQVARHRFSSIADPLSPCFPRGVVTKQSYDYDDEFDGCEYDTRYSNGTCDVDLCNLSQEMESMDLDEPPVGDTTLTSVRSNCRRSSRDRLFDNSIFTTGANESSFHIDASFPLSENSNFGRDSNISQWADETAPSVATTINNDALNRTADTACVSSSSFVARRESCASCGPSRTHVVMNYAKPRDSPIYVLPAPKIVQYQQNAILADDGLRHSKRNRLPRLNFLQKPVYERDASGNLNLVGVSDVVVRDKLLKKHLVTDAVIAMEKEQKMKQRKRLEQEKRKKLKAAIHQQQ